MNEHSHSHTFTSMKMKLDNIIKLKSVRCVRFAFCSFFFLLFPTNVYGCLFARFNSAMQSRLLPPRSRLLKHTNQFPSPRRTTYIPMTTVAVNAVMNKRKTKRIHAAHLLCECVLVWHGQVKIIDYAILPVTF